jgi:SAM-dependent methyltransferase
MWALFHSFLHSPGPYVAIQRALGADRLRRICLDEVLLLREGERVLDFGCGPGYVLNYMLRVDCVGVDTDPRCIDYAKDIIPGEAASCASSFRRRMSRRSHHSTPS